MYMFQFPMNVLIMYHKKGNKLHFDINCFSGLPSLVSLSSFVCYVLHSEVLEHGIVAFPPFHLCDEST